jgi:hypothetical protein
VDRSIVASDLEIPVVWPEPAIDHVDDLDASTGDLEPPRRFLPAVSGVAIDLHVHGESPGALAPRSARRFRKRSARSV